MKNLPTTQSAGSSLRVLVLAASLALLPGTWAGPAPFPFTEDFESILNTNYWTRATPWGPTLETAHGGGSSLADSPTTFLNPLGTYAANADVSATLAVDLRFTTRPMLTFWQRYVFEPGQDYGWVEVSKDLGATWTRWMAFSDTGSAGWSQVRLDLGEYAGTQTLIRWRVKTDSLYQYDGWYVDDVQLQENPAPARYPFADAMDTASGATNWLGSAWRQVMGSATNAGTGMSWRCQVGNGSQPGGDLNTCLTYSGKLNLGSAVNPKLSFWWRAGSQHGNLLYAQVSPDGGRNWQTIWNWDSVSDKSMPWTRQQVDLNSYVGQTNLALRFLAYNRPPGYRLALDFQVDDVLVDEAPLDVGVTAAAGSDPRHSALLSWTASTATDFAYYAIYRSTSAGVDPSDTLIATISNKVTVSFQDTNLPMISQTYFYRVLVWDTQGLHNWGTNDVSYRTAWGQIAGYPFTETFEGNDAYWASDWLWAISTELSHGGTHCLSDSPGASYANSSDLSAYLRMNLGTATRPMLSFWQRYGLEPGQDYGFVEVSSDNGASWTRWCGVTSQSGAAWARVQVDLGAYAGTQAIIRFRLRTDGASPYDGWYLDDVEVRDFGSKALGYPFADNADSTASPSNWVTSAWQQVAGSATTNSGMSWRCLLGNGSQPGGDMNSTFTANGTFNLTGALNPKLWFWWRAGSQHGNIIYAQVSTDGGKNWVSLWSWDSVSDKSMAWTRQQVDLNAYIGVTNLTVRFYAYNRPPGYRLALDFQVDDIVIGEQPAPPPEIAAAVWPGTDPRHGALLTWSNSAAPAFSWYGIYRSTSPNVTVGNQLVTSISNRNTLSFQDTGLDVCGQTYYYRVIVWDTNGLHNMGTNDLAYKTAWGQNITSLPFSDGLEGPDARWALDRPWGITTEAARTGTHSLTDSPGTNYANSVDASAYLNVNLGSAARPMLSFWQRYGLEPGIDYGFVEVSSDNGLNWTRWFAVTGQSGTNWTNVQIDLGSYAGTQALIRFRLKTDGQYPYDGWYLDDVEVKDFGLASKSYPFYDPMDTAAGASNWVSSAWRQVPGSATSSGGSSWQCLIGSGSQPVSGDYYFPLTLNGNLNLATAVNPKLSFWWRASSQHGNLLYAQVSTDSGHNWVNLWAWDSVSDKSMAWTRTQLDLTSYVGRTNLALRFLAYNRPPGYRFAVDFQVDEVLVDEAPLDAGLTIAAGTDPRHNAVLNWTASSATDFAYYAIYRSTSPGVDPTDTLVTTISNKATISFQDLNLPVINQTYYYRVLGYDTQGLHNWGGAEVSYRTAWGQLAGFPFTDNFESGDAYWAADRPWAWSTEPSRSGTHCLSDSPGADYADNIDLSAYLRVSLGTATRPVLTFWQRYGLEPNQDYGFVEVSLDGGNNWTRWNAVTSQTGFGWQQAEVDLGSYAGSQVIIRFRLKSTSANPYDGWYLDDVEIKDFGTVALGYPYFENMDTTTSPSNWVSSVWQQVPGSATTGSGQSWRCLLGSGSQPVSGDYNFPLTLNGTVNLRGAVSPRLWFWWRAGSQHGNILYAQVSTDGGKNWASVWAWDSVSDKSMAWTRQEVDLNSYAGQTNLTLRFYAYNRPPGYRFSVDFQVDDVLISEGGGCPAILTSSPLPVATRGYAYNLFLQATNGSPPYVWSVVSNSLPAGLSLNPASGSLSGTSTNLGTYTFWLGVNASNVCSAKKQFTLSVEEYLPLYASHTASAFVSPGTNIVYCQVDNQTGRRLLALTWSPTLPAGWSLVTVTGDGGPEIGPDAKILFQAASLTNAPLRFNYSVRVPAGETQARQIGGAATVLLESIALERTVPATPNPLFTAPRLYHSADCDTNWVMESTEANRVLAYWRAQAYQLDANSCDGYAPGSGGVFGALHSADYRSPWWVVDGTELNRVLAYWRSGCYKRDVSGADGYATCTNTGGRAKKDFDPPIITQQAPALYTAGSTFMVTNSLRYTAPLMSLLWRPQLPAGWTVTSVIADGLPELLGGDIVWTGAAIPPTPITVLYVVQVPSDAQGVQELRGQVEYQFVGGVNPTLAYANQNPLVISPPYVKFTQLQRLANGRVQLSLLGYMNTPVRIQSAANLANPDWTTLTNLTSLNGTLQFTDVRATNAVQRYYRTIAP